MIAAMLEVARQTFTALMRRAGVACAVATIALAIAHEAHQVHAQVLALDPDTQCDLIFAAGALGVPGVASLVVQRWQRAGLLRLAGPNAGGYGMLLAYGVGAGLFASFWLVPLSALVLRDVANEWSDVLSALPATGLFLIASAWLGGAIGQLGRGPMATFVLAALGGGAVCAASCWLLSQALPTLFWEDNDATVVLYGVAFAQAALAQLAIALAAFGADRRSLAG